MQRAYAAGADAFLTKPVLERELLATLRDILPRARRDILDAHDHSREAELVGIIQHARGAPLRFPGHGAHHTGKHQRARLHPSNRFFLDTPFMKALSYVGFGLGLGVVASYEAGAIFFSRPDGST